MRAVLRQDKSLNQLSLPLYDKCCHLKDHHFVLKLNYSNTGIQTNQSDVLLYSLLVSCFCCEQPVKFTLLFMSQLILILSLQSASILLKQCHFLYWMPVNFIYCTFKRQILLKGVWLLKCIWNDSSQDIKHCLENKKNMGLFCWPLAWKSMKGLNLWVQHSYNQVNSR